MVEAPEGARRSNRRGEQTRRELLDAGWRLVDGMQLQEMLASLTGSAVAAEAGVTTGAYRHHFTGIDHLVTAMVDTLFTTDPVEEDLRAITAILSTSDRPVEELPQAAALASWELSHSEGHRRFFRRCHLVQNRADNTTLSDGRLLADVVRDRYWGDFVDQASEVYQMFLDLSGRRVMEPFTLRQLARVLVAILEGMLHKARVDPEAISAEVYSDLIVTIVATMTAARDDPVTLSDLELELGASGRGGDVVWLRRTAVAALPLFGSPVPVRFSTVGEFVGVAPATLAARFGTLTALAAAGVAVCLDDVEEAAGRFAAVDPTRALTDALCVVARAARAHPVAARAAVSERLYATVGPAEPAFDVRAVVELEGPLRPLVRDIWGEELAGSLVELLVDEALLIAATRSRMAPAEVASMALLMAEARAEGLACDG